jgi:hypothetical protein
MPERKPGMNTPLSFSSFTLISARAPISSPSEAKLQSLEISHSARAECGRVDRDLERQIGVGLLSILLY